MIDDATPFSAPAPKTPDESRSASALAFAERRRHPRQELCAPVTVRTPSGGIVEGFTENLSYSGVLIQSLTGLPRTGEPCAVEIDLPLGPVMARGVVARVDEAAAQFAVDLRKIERNGRLLLALQITAPDE